MMLIKMLWAFFKIGLFTIGGGYAMIPLITRDLVGNGWMTVAEVTDVIAIAKMTPGPFAVNTATFAGMKIYGVGGAIACTFGVILPSLIITMVVARFFFDFQKHKLVQGALKGIRPVVVALIAYAVWNVASLTLFHSGMPNPTSMDTLWQLLSRIDWRAIVVLAVSLLLLF
ncbi:MAG: chromate transporter, partial [Firmicutes bacterium]|nr:chromate transporter [Bacillota bacterium]